MSADLEWAIHLYAPYMKRDEFDPIFRSVVSVLPNLIRSSSRSATTLRTMTEADATLAVYDVLLTNQLTPAFRIFKVRGERLIRVYLGNFLMDLPPCTGRGAKERIIIERGWGGIVEKV